MLSTKCLSLASLNLIRTSHVFNWNEFVGRVVSLSGKIWLVVGQICDLKKLS